jgi:hypothetical protein
MSIGLLDLYPRAWRDRYGEEFADLLEARPPSLSDRLDIIRGAFDATVNPRRAGPSRREVHVLDRFLAIAAVAAGVLFSTWAATIVLFMPTWEDMGSIDTLVLGLSYAAGLLASIFGMLVLLGMALRHVEDMGSVGLIGATVASLGFLALLNESSLMAIGFLCGGTVLMSPALARAVGWMAAVMLVVATIFIAVATFGFVRSDGQDRMWGCLLVVYGPAWALLGIQLRKGVRTSTRAQTRARPMDAATGAG